MGRPAGKPNKLSRDIKERASFWGDKALETVVRHLDSKDERVSLAASQTILDRAYGKPPQAQIHQGDSNHPIEFRISFRSGV